MAHWQTTSQAQRGFLLVELVIGLVIVALVMLGAAAIMGAVAQGWSDQDVTRSTQLQANQTYVRVQNALEGAKCVGYVTPSSSQSGSIFFWQNYNVHNLLGPGNSDPYDPYAGEMALIQYDPATTTLWLYQCSPAQLGSSEAEQILTSDQIGQSAEATWFTQQPFVQKQALGGPGNQSNDGTRLEVSSFQVDVSSASAASQLPVIEFVIGFTRGDGTSLTLYNTTTIRGPATQPQ